MTIEAMQQANDQAQRDKDREFQQTKLANQQGRRRVGVAELFGDLPRKGVQLWWRFLWRTLTAIVKVRHFAAQRLDVKFFLLCRLAHRKVPSSLRRRRTDVPFCAMPSDIRKMLRKL